MLAILDLRGLGRHQLLHQRVTHTELFFFDIIFFVRWCVFVCVWVSVCLCMQLAIVVADVTFFAFLVDIVVLVA